MRAAGRSARCGSRARTLGLFGDDVGLALVTLGSMVILLAVIVVSVRGVQDAGARAATSARARSGRSTEASLEAIVSADRRGRITYFNPAAERMFGYAAAEVGRRAS